MPTVTRSVVRALTSWHRWTALVFGVLLVVVSTSGALVVYSPELVRATNADLFVTTPGTDPLGFSAAIEAVQRVDPDFEPTELALKDGVFVFEGSDGSGKSYFVDAGTGNVNGYANINAGVIGFLVNLHDCALTCEGYAGYLPFLELPTPVATLAPFEGLTWGGLLLTIAGLTLVVLAVTAPIIWWPGIRRWRNAFRMRWNRGRFARDLDLHNLIGIVAVVPLLIWGLTGLNFELPGVRTVWNAVTGAAPAPDYTLPESDGAGPTISLDAAIAAAQREFPGARPSWIEMPSEDADAYLIDLVDGGPNLWAHNPTYEGNRAVGVDAHDAEDVTVFLGSGASVATSIVDEYAQPALHYGVAVNPYWRVLWFVLGMTPLVLMITGLSTWLHRRSVRARRKQSAASQAVIK